MSEVSGAPQTGDCCPVNCGGHLVVTTSSTVRRSSCAISPAGSQCARPDKFKIIIPSEDYLALDTQKKPA